MAELIRGKPSVVQSSAQITPSSTGATAIGQAVTHTGRASQQTNVGAITNQLGSAIAAQGQAQINETLTAMRNAKFSKKMSEAELEYAKRLDARTNQTMDENGNPTYGTLTEDYGAIGNDVMTEIGNTIDDPEVAAQFRAQFESRINSSQIKSLGISRQQQTDFSRASYEEYKDTKVRSAIFDMPEFAIEHIKEIESVINSKVAVGELSAQEGVAEIQRIKQEVTVSHVRQAIEANPEDALNSLNENGSVFPISSGALDSLKSEASRAVSAQRKLRKDQEAAIKAKFDGMLNQANEFLVNGHSIPPDMMDVLTEATKHSSELSEEVRLLKMKQAPVEDFSRMSTDQRASVLKELERSGVTDPDMASVVTTLKEINTNLNKQLEADPVSFAESQNLFEPLEPLDFSGDISEQLDKRSNARSMIHSRFGIASDGLKDSERSQLLRHISSKSPEDKVSTLATIVATLGEEGSAELMGDFSEKGDPLMAYSGMLISEGKSDVARSILNGTKLIKDKEASLPSNKVWQLALVDMSPVLPQYENSRQAADVQKAIRAIYADKAVTAGLLDPTVVDEGLLEEATREATNGGAIEYGPSLFSNSTIEPPEWNMTEDEFGRWMHSITPEEIEAFGGILSETSAQDTLRNSELKNIGRGKYLVFPEGVNGGMAIGHDGDVFILDYNAINKARKEKPSKIELPEDTSEQDFLDSLGASKQSALEIPSQASELSANKEERISQVSTIANSVWEDPIMAKVATAQAILESGLNSRVSGLAKQNNLFGIKGKGSAGSSAHKTKEFINGVEVSVDDSFARNNDLIDSFAQHKRLLSNARYRRVLLADSPEAAAMELQKAGYATDPQYAQKLISIMDSL